MPLINLEIENKEIDLNEKIIDLILNSKYVSAEDKDLAWQRIKQSTYFYQ